MSGRYATEQAFFEERQKTANTCAEAPKGWICGGDKGHEGPCAAYPADMVVPDTGWLLESKLDDGSPIYVNHIVNGGNPILTTDVNDAIRFSRREDAQRIADDIRLTMGVLTPTEHVWL